MTQDEQHLQLLSIFYYVVAVIAGFFACIPVIHLVLGIMMLSGTIPIDDTGQKAPEFLGWIFIAIALLLITFGVVLAVVMILVGRFLTKRVRYTFCLVAAAVSCLFMPLGTILGIFTIVVLSRPSVKQMFGVTTSAPA